MKTPKALDAIVDKVLRYKPKPKSKPAKRRKRRATKIHREKQQWLTSNSR
jgi:hypothetical protein